MINDLVIFGSQYHDLVKLINAVNRSCPTWRLRGFIDDRPDTKGKTIFDYPVLGDRSLVSQLIKEPGLEFFNNVSGNVRDASAVAQFLETRGAKIANLVHPSVDLFLVQLGHGCILPDGCLIGSGTILGDYITARLRVVISHDVAIGDFVFLGPGCIIGGGADIRTGSFIGAGATVLGRIKIGAGTIVGAGAVVVDDLPSGVTVAGVPARIIKNQGRDI